MMCQPNWVCTGFDELAGPEREGDLVERRAPSGRVVIVSWPPCDFEPGSIEYFFASVAKSAPPFSCA